MIRTTILLLLLLFLAGCENEKLPLPPLDPPEEEIVEMEEEEILTPEETAEALLHSEGKILSIKRSLDHAVVVVEVRVEKEGEILVYIVDPALEKILSITKEQAQELTLEEAHFLAREALGGTTRVRSIMVFDNYYQFVFEKEKKGYEVQLDKASQEAQLLGESVLSELRGKINMDLFQAVQKTEVIYGKLDILELYYKPWDDSVSHIVIKARQEEGGAWVTRIFEMDTYSGVISVTNE